jgi:hypothetical protein
MTGLRSLTLGAGCAALLVACGSSGSSSAVPQTGSNRPLTASTVDVRPSGSTDFAVDPRSVSFQIYNSALLRMTVGVTSHAAVTSTVTMTATLLDASGASIGTAVGGAIDVPQGGTVQIQLTGSRPTGVVAAVNLVIAGQPAPAAHS